MHPQLIEPLNETSADLGWKFDVGVCAYFRAMHRRLVSQSTPHKPLRAMGVTSCGRGEGVSTVAARLAIAAAEDGEKKVLLVDANPFEPSLHRTFEVGQTPGFLDVIRGTHLSSETLQPTGLPNLWVLPVGTGFGKPSAVDPTTERDLLAELSHEFAFIVVDMPHVDQLVEDAVGFATALDGIVLVVDAERTGRVQFQAAAGTLSQFRLLGAVLNKRQEPR